MKDSFWKVACVFLAAWCLFLHHRLEQVQVALGKTRELSVANGWSIANIELQTGVEVEHLKGTPAMKD